ncbi:MAG: adenylate/guanylate cyclase domain-containing protein [Candidatus Limnocylindria bacterium]
MPNLPSGTVTFVFSDIEGSTTLLKRLGDERYAALLATHRRIVRETFGSHHGQEIDTQGDAFFYSFPRARDAVAAAVEVQRAHEQEDWPEGAVVRMRLGLHTGEPAVGDEGYTGLDVVRASRIAAVGRGGQVLLSETTRAIVAGDLPDGVALHSLGDQRLRDIDRPEPLHELRIDDVSTSSAIPVASPTDPDLPGIPDPTARLPAWLRGSMGAFGARTSELIEQRVLAELNDAFTARDERPRPRALAPPPSPRASVADEIAKLQALRDAGAMTEEQYAKAVDRAIESAET